MKFWKVFADIATVSRGFIALLLVYLGVNYGAEKLPLAVLLLMIAWTTDVLDGAAARKSKLASSWIGHHDLTFDVSIAVSLWFYLFCSGFLNLQIALGLFGLSVLALIIWGPRTVLGVILEGLVYGVFIWIAFQNITQTAQWLVIWIFAAVVITWPRIPERDIPNFIHAVINLFRKNVPENTFGLKEHNAN